MSDAASTVETPNVVMAAPAAIATMTPEQRLQLMRAPFARSEVSKLPQVVVKDGDKEACEAGTRASRDRYYCNGYHAPAIHLDYVGHAALTNRLLEVDPHWNWEPMAFDATGAPAMDENKGMWIRLTVCGVTRPGYGSADGKSGGNAVKEAIGDALRNAAMRFGAALDLWHKGDLTTPGALEEANTPPEAGGRDWAAEAETDGTEAGILALWREAKAAGAPITVLDVLTGKVVRAKKASR